ncbi:MAG: hypothetical protein GF355_11490 [Candidatus Eisenbacteria bacterium]|nr:hypothetical protein [Candidatus Eisenbacteria bacterium]
MLRGDPMRINALGIRPLLPGFMALTLVLAWGATPRADYIDYSNALHYAGNATAADTVWNRLHQEDGLVCVAAGNDGLVVFDGTDPAHLLELSTCPTIAAAKDVVLHEGLAYVAAGEAGLLIIDVRDPYAPEQVGQFAIGVSGKSVEWVGDHIVVGGYPVGLFFIDVSSPDDPNLDHILTTPGEATDLEWEPATDRLYVADGHDDLLVVDSAASPPSILGHGGSANYSMSVAAYGDYAYVGSYNNEEFRVYDVGDPADPQVVDVVDTHHPCLGLEVCGQTLFAANYNSGLKIYSLYHPDEPSLRGRVPVVMRASDLAIWEDGEVVYLGGSFSSSVISMLEAVSIATHDPLRPEEEVPLSDAYTCHAAEGFAYVSTDFFDVSIVDLGTLGVVGALPGFPGVCSSLLREGDILHVGCSDGSGGYHCTAWVRDPSEAMILCTLPLPDYVRDIDVQGSLVAVANISYCTLIDAEDPENPEVLISFAYEYMEYAVIGVRLDGDRLYVSGYNLDMHPYLWIVDIQVPEHPVTINMLELPSDGLTARMDLESDVAYLAGYLYFHVIDVSNPEAPEVKGQLRLSDGGGSTPPRIYVEDSIAYVVTSEDGCYVIDCTDPWDPFFTGQLYFHEYTYDVALWEDDVYVSGFRDEGLLCRFDRHQADASSSANPLRHTSQKIRLTVAPNPISAQARLSYQLHRPAQIRLGVYDVTGRCVRVLRHGFQPAGRHSIVWDGHDGAGNPLATGSYWARLALGDGIWRSPIRLIR